MFDALIASHSPSQLLFLAFSALIAGLARGFSGFGAALIFMPLASAAIGPQVAAPLLLVVDAFASIGMIPNAWPRADRHEVGTMAIGALIGVPVGTAVLALADPLVVRWIIIAIVVLLLSLLMSGWRYHGRPKRTITIAVGAVAGLFSGGAQVGGPPVVAYWLSGAIPVTIVRANIVLYFAVSTLLTGITYAAGGLLVLALIPLALITGPIYALGLYTGSRLFRFADDRIFRRVCYGLIAAAAVLGLPLLDPLTH